MPWITPTLWRFMVSSSMRIIFIWCCSMWVEGHCSITWLKRICCSPNKQYNISEILLKPFPTCMTDQSPIETSSPKILFLLYKKWLNYAILGGQPLSNPPEPHTAVHLIMLPLKSSNAKTTTQPSIFGALVCSHMRCWREGFPSRARKENK